MDRPTIIGLLNFLPIAAAISEDGECQRITVNKAMAQIMRTVYSEKIPAGSSFTTLPFYKVYHNGEQMREEDMPLRQAVLRGREIIDYEMDITRPDGSMASVLAYSIPWRDEDGNITGGYAIYKDVSMVRRLETEIASLQNRLQMALEEKLAAEHELAQG